MLPAVSASVMLVGLERSNLCLCNGQGQYLFPCDSRKTLGRITRKWLARNSRTRGGLFLLFWWPLLRDSHICPESSGRTRVQYWAALKLKTLRENHGSSWTKSRVGSVATNVHRWLIGSNTHLQLSVGNAADSCFTHRKWEQHISEKAERLGIGQKNVVHHEQANYKFTVFLSFQAPFFLLQILIIEPYMTGKKWFLSAPTWKYSCSLVRRSGLLFLWQDMAGNPSR